MFFTPDRIPYLEYTAMSLPVDIGFFMRPPPLSYVSNIYRLAFTDAVWICSSILCFMITVIIAMTFKIRSTIGELDNSLGFSDFFLIATAYLCQMGAEVSPNKFSSKVAMVRFEQILV